jgi:hypothetical protein
MTVVGDDEDDEPAPQKSLADVQAQMMRGNTVEKAYTEDTDTEPGEDTDEEVEWAQTCSACYCRIRTQHTTSLCHSCETA